MSHVHGTGQLVTVIGGGIALFGVAMWLRFSQDWARDAERWPRWTVFVDRAIPVFKAMTVAGVLVALVGLIIWWATA